MEGKLVSFRIFCVLNNKIYRSRLRLASQTGKTELGQYPGQYPAMLTSRLVDNPYE